jgi:alkylation response protein AidB-like acyl-CoA dehydrogenase
VSIDLSFRAEARELADSVRRACQAAAGSGADEPLPRALWQELAAMGVLALTVPDAGDAEALVAAATELGSAGIGGPLIGVMLAARVLDPGAAARVTRGESIPSVGTPPLMAWAPLADVFIEVDGSTAYRAEPSGAVEPVDTLAGEPWGRCALTRGSEIVDWHEASSLAEIGAAAYLLGAGQRLLDTAAEYAAQRTQFGRPIGDFQATAHPLASCHVHLAAADTLVRLAADAFDTGAAGMASRATTARVSAASAATETAYRAHQTLGAMGFTVEGPIGRLSGLIRQTSAAAAAICANHDAVLTPYGM